MGQINWIDKITGVDEHLAFVEKVLSYSNLSLDTKSNVFHKIDEIRRRRQDSSLYLAIIGEFSSGKTTFINALLRDELLKISALTTTATATVLKFGKELGVNVDFRHHNRKKLKASKKDKLKINLRTKKIRKAWFPICGGMSVRKFIYEVTSNDQVAKHIKKVTITHPSLFLADQVNIIDTPGTNATIAEHGKITRNIVATQADAAVIVIPSQPGLSKTLLDFLSVELQPYIHRCIFIITKMDIVRKREQESLVSQIRKRLSTSLGLENPYLLTSAPQIILDVILGEEVPKKSLDWENEFIKLESEIKKLLYKQKNLVIAEKLLRLLSQLFKILSQSVREKWKQYHDREKAIQRETIQDLDLFIVKQQNLIQEKVDTLILKTAQNIRHYQSKHRDSGFQEIRSSIFDAKNKGDVNNTVKKRVDSILKSHQSILNKEIERELDKLWGQAKTISQSIDLKFDEAYQKLSSLSGSIEKSSSSDSKINLRTKSTLSSTQSLVSEFNQSNVLKTLGAGVAGGAAGTFLGTIFIPVPIIGTIVGMAIGGIISSIFGPSLDEYKTKIWENLRPHLNSYFDEVDSHIDMAINSQKKNIIDGLNMRLQQYTMSYREAVKDLLAKQKEELLLLTTQKHETQVYLDEIERRSDSLFSQQQRLKASK